MSWNYNEYREYGVPTNEIDYAHPEYYRQEAAAPQTAPQSPDIYGGYHLTVPYYAQTQAYQGPASLEGYTQDAGAEQRDAATAEGGTKKKGIAGAGGGLAALVAALLKLQWLGFLLKFGWAGISAAVSIVLYSFIFGWSFAIGLVALLFVHEMGHAVVMKLKGIPVGGLIFIPLLGAAVFMKQMPQNARDEAEVGIAGPLAGALASLLCLVMASFSPNQVWAPLAYFGFFINLINLVPIVPFDGGRVVAAIDRRVWLIGLLGLLAYAIWSLINGTPSLWLFLFVFMAGTQFFARRKAANTLQGREYYNVSVVTRVTLAVLYFGLAAVLLLGMSLSHGMMFPLGS